MGTKRKVRGEEGPSDGNDDDEESADEGTAVERLPKKKSQQKGAPPEAGGGEAGEEPKKKKKKLGKKEREKLKRLKDSGADAASIAKAMEETKTRYTVFAGNISYDTTEEQIRQHFMGGQGLGEKEIIGVRMLTDKGTGQFKGTAFIDLLDDKAFKNALKMHHTKLQDRKINVEPTVGGGGKGQNRMEKLQKKRETFAVVRTKRIKKELANPPANKSAVGGGNKPKQAEGQKPKAGSGGRDKKSKQ